VQGLPAPTDPKSGGNFRAMLVIGLACAGLPTSTA
jgi:hypothetical protein